MAATTSRWGRRPRPEARRTSSARRPRLPEPVPPERGARAALLIRSTCSSAWVIREGVTCAHRWQQADRRPDGWLPFLTGRSPAADPRGGALPGRGWLCRGLTVRPWPPALFLPLGRRVLSVSYTHLRAHETRHDLVCRL